MKKEFWKAIPGYEGLYEMTLDGRVRSLNYLGHKGKIKELKQFIVNNYYCVYLYKENKKRKFYISQIMALTFLEHTIKGHDLVVDHINENKLDNALENLQIITQRKNVSRSKKRNLPTGVYFRKDRGKYQMRFWLDGKLRGGGYFLNPEEASQAYQKATKEL